MIYHIEERDAIRFVGLKFFVQTNIETGMPDPKTVSGFWDNLSKEDFEKLNSMSDSLPSSVVGVFGEKHDNGFDYWIAAATTMPCPKDYAVVEIPATKWLVIQAKGPNPSAIQSAFRNVYINYFPNSKKYTRCWDIYEIESFSDGDASAEDYIAYGWVPIHEKN